LYKRKDVFRGKHPGRYRGLLALLLYAANIFGYGTAKDEAKDDKYKVLTWWCNGPHGKRGVTFYKGKFPGRLILRFGDIPWPPHFPDLTAQDFPLWGIASLKCMPLTHTPPKN
jgi:hypothetical protein